MGSTTLSRIAVFAALLSAGACSDSTSPEPPDLLPAGRMTVTPSGATLEPGQMVQLTAHLITSSGDALQGVTISWTSSNELVATVSDRGEVFARHGGHAVITARANGNAQIATIHVRGKQPGLRPNMEPGRRTR
jgi:uncharacterized protein YjdB